MLVNPKLCWSFFLALWSSAFWAIQLLKKNITTFKNIKVNKDRLSSKDPTLINKHAFCTN